MSIYNNKNNFRYRYSLIDADESEIETELWAPSVSHILNSSFALSPLGRVPIDRSIGIVDLYLQISALDRAQEQPSAGA